MHTVELWTLAPGQRFALPMAERTGTLIYANERRARVWYDGSARHVEITGDDGAEVVAFEAPGCAVDIAARTMVIPLVTGEEMARKIAAQLPATTARSLAFNSLSARHV